MDLSSLLMELDIPNINAVIINKIFLLSQYIGRLDFSKRDVLFCLYIIRMINDETFVLSLVAFQHLLRIVISF